MAPNVSRTCPHCGKVVAADRKWLCAAIIAERTFAQSRFGAHRLSQIGSSSARHVGSLATRHLRSAPIAVLHSQSLLYAVSLNSDRPTGREARVRVHWRLPYWSSSSLASPCGSSLTHSSGSGLGASTSTTSELCSARQL